MKKIFKKLKLRDLILLIAGLIIGGSIGITATTYVLKSSEIQYTNDKSVQQAIDELFVKAENCGTGSSETLPLGTVTVSGTQISIPYTGSYDKITCVYGTDENYGSVGTISNNVCTFSGSSNTKYYYKLIATKISNNTGTVYENSGNKTTNSESVPPTNMVLSTNSDSTYTKTKSVTVTLKDTGGSGLASGSVKYGWSTSTTTEPSSYKTVNTSGTNGEETTNFVAYGSGFTGSYYLWVVPVSYKDTAGNANATTVISTGKFVFDNTPPTIKHYDLNYAIPEGEMQIGFKMSDEHSGIASCICYGVGTTNTENCSQYGNSTTYICHLSGYSCGPDNEIIGKVTDSAGNSSTLSTGYPPYYCEE